MTTYDVIILGAGAAGLMAALTAGQRGRRVLVLDHAEVPGKKILISGGGRCNFTNLECAPDKFLSNNRHFAKSALARYTQFDFIDMVARHGIAYHEKTLGQLFCDGSARAIVTMLLDEAARGDVTLKLNHAITDVRRADHFVIETDKGSFSAPALILATGGPSIPKMGATGFAYEVAKRFGLPIIPPRPALVPFTAGGAELDLMTGLAGVAVPDARVSIGKRAFREALLFTHRGLSGPAILQISSYWQPGETVRLDLLPEGDAAEALLAAKRSRAKSELKTILAQLVPSRLAAALTPEAAAARALADLPDKLLLAVAEKVQRWPFIPVGTEGYAKAEVTAGGIDTKALSSQTMEAADVPGLYAIGEAVDVTGWLGGYNFQWAWSSGWAAGMAV
ncbi:membrane protein [Elstera litoralis]|uniref:Membrane protein n=1 Tax=Elstera litoralis TaxID=552518 RepID=A0A0F3IW43_9PROT|nr:NAD(P)/FAD-dependent oxidoreductase [Elstera litoralis]KJV10847.1 membrane protein [Elstera litoralis]